MRACVCACVARSVVIAIAIREHLPYRPLTPAPRFLPSLLLSFPQDGMQRIATVLIYLSVGEPTRSPLACPTTPPAHMPLAAYTCISRV